MLRLASYFFFMFLAFHFREMEKNRGMFPSLFPFLSHPLPHPRELDKEQRKNKERQNDSWGRVSTQINACILH